MRREIPSMLLPVPVTQHNIQILSRDAVVAAEETAQYWVNVQRLEGVYGHLCAKHTIRRIALGNIRFRVCTKAADVSKGRRAPPQLTNPPFWKKSSAAPDAHQTVLLRKRQWTQHDRIHEGKHGNVRPDSQG
jgi:hypothetical protein